MLIAAECFCTPVSQDGVEVPMRDIQNDTKAAQLEERSTFLGLDSNRLSRWDMRDPHGVVQEMSANTLEYAGGKDYARRTNFSCMATSGASARCPMIQMAYTNMPCHEHICRVSM